MTKSNESGGSSVMTCAQRVATAAAAGSAIAATARPSTAATVRSSTAATARPAAELWTAVAGSRRSAMFSALLLALLLNAVPSSAAAQSTNARAGVRVGGEPVRPVAGEQARDGWNDARVLALVERGRQRRAEPLADPGLRNYRALAEGSIYFYIDPDAADPVLMRADQVAVELYWAAPDRTRQVLLGQRMEKRLPIRDFHYYIDRLTVVQNGFGDEIQVGEGMDVRNVVHPLAEEGARAYDYRLADSLVLRLPGSDPLRAYEVVVRPRQPDLPGFVGSIFLDGATGALVRMTFGFTRASYVDPRNDYVRITLDHGLWQGRFWLPHEQQVVVRRELPELDLGAGTVIRATLRVTDYEFDEELPAGFFAWPAVTAAPRAEREAYTFERGMYDDLVRDGLAMGADVRAIEREARRLLREQVLTGLPRTRPAVPGASSVFRYNRVEGAFLGAGVRTTTGDADLLAAAGYAVGARRPSATLQARFDAGVNSRVEASLHHRQLRDAQPSGAVPGTLNTLAVLAAGRDYLDPWFASGGSLAVQQRLPPRASLRIAAALERQVPGTLAISGAPIGSGRMRAVLPFAEGTQATVSAELTGAAPAYRGARPSITLRTEAGVFEDARFAAADASVAVAGNSAQLGVSSEVRLAGGIVTANSPLQRHYFLGGPGTLPGHAFRSLAGRRFALATAEATWSVAYPWFGLRSFVAAGATGGGAPGLDDRDSPVLGTAGIGAALFHGILRVDLARGIGPGGRETVIFSVDPRLRPWL